jgi:hypothetical protein
MILIHVVLLFVSIVLWLHHYQGAAYLTAAFSLVLDLIEREVNR